jgi:hypothetical protein
MTIYIEIHEKEAQNAFEKIQAESAVVAVERPKHAHIFLIIGTEGMPRRKVICTKSHHFFTKYLRTTHNQNWPFE